MSRPPIRLEQVVLSAIRSARGAGRHHTAYALTNLITNHRDDPNVERVLRAVATSGGNIHPSLLNEFSVMVQQKKRESRRKSLTERRGSASFAGTSIRLATPSYNSPSKKVAAVSDTIPQQHGASRSSPMHQTISPPKGDAHVNKKLKTNNFGHDTQVEVPDSEMDASKDQQTFSDASSLSSELSDVDDNFIESPFNEVEKFAPTEPAPEERATIAEIQAKKAPSGKRKSRVVAPRLRIAANSSNVAASVSPSSSVFPSNNKSQKKQLMWEGGKLDPNDPIEILRRRARNITNNGEPFAYSHIRSPLTSQEPESESEEAESSIAASRTTGLRLRLRNVPMGLPNDESEKSSPTFLSFQHDLAPASSTNSRQSTPNPYGRPPRKAKTGPRVKSSSVLSLYLFLSMMGCFYFSPKIVSAHQLATFWFDDALILSARASVFISTR